MMDLLETAAWQALPRILTQVCRDPSSPFFGCADRNWWHYKIRDFPSIILQQAGYTLLLAAERTENDQEVKSLRRLAGASCRFWQGRALRYGAFEEYYPFEQGYPPLAFSTLSVAKIVDHGVISFYEVEKGLEVAARQLLSRFESEAANQQMAGLAALAVLRKLYPQMVDDAVFSNLLDRTLALQMSDGWFPEYGGSDLGYLTVTMDCLFDLYDYTEDPRCWTAIERAFTFISWFVHTPFRGAGMHNSRNTDYLVPYALARLAHEEWHGREEACSLFNRVFSDDSASSHFLFSIDDRYWCHYIGHSVFRALNIRHGAGNALAIGSVSHSTDSSEKKESGHVFLRKRDSFPALLFSGRKGGALSIQWGKGNRISDYGWHILSKGRLFFNHWWSPEWRTAREEDTLTCSGPLVLHPEHAATPFKHFLLRCASLFAGRRIIALLKKVLIFRAPGSNLVFERRVVLRANVVVVEDSVVGLAPDDTIARAPRTSKRHVASADAYHYEDLTLSDSVSIQDERIREGDVFRCVTRYFVEEEPSDEADHSDTVP